jgi:hypothetical protein
MSAVVRKNAHGKLPLFADNNRSVGRLGEI